MTIDKLFEILMSDKPSGELIKNEDELFELIPVLKAAKGFDQNNDWHIYDVYEHTLHVVDNVPNNKIIRTTALFHDTGKPFTYQEDSKGVGHFYGHYIFSQKIFDAFAMQYKFDKNFSNMVSNLIYYHDINVDRMKDRDINKMINILGYDGVKMLFQHKRADLLAQNPKYHGDITRCDEQEKKLIFKMII